MSSSLPRLLLVGSGSEIRHRQLLSDMTRRASLVLLQSGEVTWQAAFVSHHVRVDVADLEATVGVALALAREHGAEAVVTYDEFLLPLVGEICHAGPRGLPRAAASVARDKNAQRRLLQSGERPVLSQLVDDADAAAAVAERFGYPVVVKPRNLSGNLGTRIVESPAALRRMVEEAGAPVIHGMRSVPGVLVEEYLPGPEYTIDCWVLDGRAEALFTTRILTDLAPNTIDVGVIGGLGVADPATVAAMEKAACEAAVACGVDRTIANVDVKWTRGEPRILEVNFRPGGLLGLLALEVSGLRIGEALADVALGKVPATRPPVGSAAGLAFIYPRRAALFAGFDVPPALAAESWLTHMQETTARGSPIQPPDVDPWGYAGWAFVTGKTGAAVEARIERAWAEISIREAM